MEQSKNTENKTLLEDDDYDDDKMEPNNPLEQLERFIEDIDSDSGNECSVDKSSKSDGDMPDQLTSFREFIENIKDVKEDKSSIVTALSDAASVAHFLEDAAETHEDEKTFPTEGAKRSGDARPETCKKQRMQAADAVSSRSNPVACFLCKKPVKDFGLRLKMHIPAVLKLSCNHLVHTVCMSYLCYVRGLPACPLCGELVQNCPKKYFYMTHYLRSSNMIQTKLLEFMETATFRNGEKKLVNWLYRKVNGRKNIDFVKENEADKWPVLKSNEFVNEVLGRKSGYTNRFLKDLALYSVSNHKCDQWCPDNCWYRRNIVLKDQFDLKVHKEYRKLKNKNGTREYAMSTDYEEDSDSEDYNGQRSCPSLVKWFEE